MIQKTKNGTSGSKKIWGHDLKIKITDNEWEKINQNTFEISSVTKLRSIQYKLINKILTTNVTRNKCNSIIPLYLLFVKKCRKQSRIYVK